RRDQFFQFRFAETANKTKAESHGMTGSFSARGCGSRLERTIPVAEIDVDGADLHAMLARVAHQLCRLIKSHLVTVEDGGAEHVRVPAFDERRGIDQKRKTCRVTFGKAIFAETFDLAEALFGEIAVVAAFDHAVDEFVAK